MLSPAERLLRSLLSGKRIGSQDPEGPLNQIFFYSKIGFTIYRTDYSPGSDDLWAKLKDLIKADLMGAVKDVTPKDEKANEKEAEALEHLTSLVCVDGRSDAEALEGRTLDELREIYMRSKAKGDAASVEDSVNGTGKAEDTPIPDKFQSHAFLWADAEVLRSLSEDTSFVKIAEADFDAEEWRLSNEPLYCGAMRMEINTIWWMWEELQMQIFEDIAPHMERDAEVLAVVDHDDVQTIPREGRELI